MAKQMVRFVAKDVAGIGSRVSHNKWTLSRTFSFWLLSALVGFLLFAAGAPSPLYGVYGSLWHFSSITITVIYAVYAFAALIASLTTGRLSDHLGRRTVTMIALIIQMAGMVAFITARNVGALIAARLLQGLGTGIAMGTISAWLLDLQPPENPRLGSLMGSIAPLAGLAAGSLSSGLLVQYGPDPLHFIFWLLLAVFAFAFVVMPVIPDLVAHKPGWLKSMKPDVGVPLAARSLFAASAPSLFAIWALGGLYLSLGPSLAISLLKANSHISGGLVIMALAGAGAVAAFRMRAAGPRVLVIRGSLVLILGIGITLAAVTINSIVGLYVGSLVAGLGFGPSFYGVYGSLAPLAPPDKRGALLTAMTMIVQIAFGVPAILAGVVVTRYGLRDTAFVYGLVVMVLAAITTVAVSRRRTS